jgi:predicted AlkP superfamily phosphohydrolase/phosphomutase
MATARRASIPAIVLVGLLCGAGCRSRQPPKVVVLGVDALHFPLLMQLVADGALPNFARLCREGSCGTVLTLAAGLPPLSPRIWTSFATGWLPRQHGISGFASEGANGQKRLLDSRDRREPALWEIASAAGKRVGVVNWLLTYPADRVNGFLISDRYVPHTARKATEPVAERSEELLAHPPEIFATLARLQVSARNPPMTADAAEAMDRDIFRLAYTALEEHPVDLLMIYTRAMDELEHVSWASHEPRPGEPPPRRDEVVEFMRRYDVMLGELTAHLGRADHLIVLSDHGMARNPESTGLSGQHSSAASAIGVLILHGPRIRPSGHASGSLLDITPTVLELLGVPPAAGMPGRVLTDAFVEQRSLPRRPEPYARTPAPTGAKPPTASADERAIIERLKKLGYVQ